MKKTMAALNNIYPLFFTLEKVYNGYIRTAKEDTGGMKEPKFRKEVVSEDRISTRIGQLLHLEALNNELPTTFHVEAIVEGTYQIEEASVADELMTAKLAYGHFSSRTAPAGKIRLFHFLDDKTIEVYGSAAKEIAAVMNVPYQNISGIPVLTYPYTEESQKSLASHFRDITMVDVTKQKIKDWYKAREIRLEEKAITDAKAKAAAAAPTGKS